MTMNIIKKICACIILLFMTAICGSIARGGNCSAVTPKTPQHTKDATRLLKTLRKAALRRAPFFGHQDALMYGQNWCLNERDSLFERSDVFDVCGQYPYVLGLDLGRIEQGSDRNLDRCLFWQMKEAAIKHYQRGGIVTISWHMDNPATRGTAWDCTGGNVVNKIITDSLFRQQFLLWLDAGADFLNSLVDSKGRKIPVLFRPWHECNLEGFWWSENACTKDEYIQLWRLTYDYFTKEKKMSQLLWVYSPYNVKTAEEIEDRYPGDQYVDVIGYELYQRSPENNHVFAESVRMGIDETVGFAKSRKKVVAFTETGFCGVPLENWWSATLGEAIKNKSIAYVHVWRNGNKTYYFAPGPEADNNDDFFRLCKNNKLRLLKK